MAQIMSNPELDDIQHQIDVEAAKTSEQVAEEQKTKDEQDAAAGKTDQQQQQRDDKGRFAKTEQKVEEKKPEEQKADEEVVYQKTIKLSDGSEITVEGKTEAEVEAEIMKVVSSAYEHQKTEETQQQKKTAEDQKQTETKSLSDDDEFALGQEFFSKPTVALEKTLQAVYGISGAELKEAVEAVREAGRLQSAVSAVEEFKTKNPDYITDDRNKLMINNYLQANKNGIVSVANLNEAYTTLKGMGLLITEKKQEATPQQPTTTTRRIVKASGIFGKSGSDTVQTQTETVPSEAKLKEMSPDDLLAYINTLQP